MLSAAMLSIRGVVQREGEVIHVVTACMEDLTPRLHAVGQMDFPHRTGPADGAKTGGYDARDRKTGPHAPLPLPAPAAESAPAEKAEPTIRLKARNFH